MSPQLKRGGDMYLDDAEPGDFCNTATGDVWRDEITVIPCDFHTRYLEWPKVRGKGAPIADHGEDPSILRRCATNEKNQHTLPNGNRVEETASWHLLIQNGAAWDRVLFQLTSTRLKASRKWLTAIRAETCMIDGSPGSRRCSGGRGPCAHRREQHSRRLVDLRRRARRAADRP